MHNIIKKTAVAAFAGAMVFGVRVNLYAANSNLNEATNPDDTTEIRLLKDYKIGNTYTNAKSPEEIFKFHVERYGLWNVGEDGNGQAKYSKDNMPIFKNNDGTSDFEINAPKGAAGSDSALLKNITVPTYAAVGDYWYKVTEEQNKVLGVIYGTNDSQTEDVTVANGGHDAVYYIHVQVTNDDNKGYVHTVTLHKTAPDSDTVTTNAAYETWYETNHSNLTGQNDKKVNDIQNKYYAGSLKITKSVQGNAGDKNELFKVKVTLKNNSGKAMNSDITYTNFYDQNGNQTDVPTSITWTNNEVQQEFYIKDGTTVTFDNIPYGVTYTVEEERPTDDKYTHTFEFTDSGADRQTTFDNQNLEADVVSQEETTGTDDEKWNAAKATGSIADESDTITITNKKESTIDIGVFTTNAPYIAMLLLVAGAMIVFVHRKSEIEE